MYFSVTEFSDFHLQDRGIKDVGSAGDYFIAVSE